ncbi:hypothetical protein Tco_1113143 [Tanacetum coccineum]|uniref:Uncharacterized protein n=1 Tax=Tanacetum coccineum TaxID=301880 RepID=A0ABQ5IRH5_9ASTR
MAISVDRIHQQYQKENVVDFDFDVVEESKEFQKLSLTHVPLRPQVPKKKVDNEDQKEFQKLSLTDNMPPQPQVPKSGKPLEQKPAVDFLYHDITKCLAPNTYSPCSAYYNSLPKPEWMRHEKPNSASTYSPSNPPDWANELDCKLPENVEEYVRMKRSMLASVSLN